MFHTHQIKAFLTVIHEHALSTTLKEYLIIQHLLGCQWLPKHKLDIRTFEQIQVLI